MSEGKRNGQDPGANWDLTRLLAETSYQVLATDGAIRSVVFPGEPYHGRPTDVFAYVGIPPRATGPVPGMICVHGGLGAAFRSWVELWVRRGYAAIAVDLNACGADRVPLAQGGPALNDGVIFDPTAAWTNRWAYHAVAAVIRSHTILRCMPGVDPNRIGITGVSWGGYLTCIVAGLDPRLACAIPVYGCGFLQSNSAADWMKRFAAMTPAQRQDWHEHCDPSRYLSSAGLPILFVSGVDDFAFPLDSVQRTYALPQSSVAFCIRVGMAHSQEAGIAPDEIHLFADQQLRGGEPLPTFGPSRFHDRQLQAGFTSRRPLKTVSLLCTSDRGRWQDRKWRTLPALVKNGEIGAEVPPGVTACFLGLEDDRGAYASSPHLALA
ncbi:MAG: dienelactone hydrolase family protein [Opitutaceae bacterium]